MKVNHDLPKHNLWAKKLGHQIGQIFSVALPLLKSDSLATGDDMSGQRNQLSKSWPPKGLSKVLYLVLISSAWTISCRSSHDNDESPDPSKTLAVAIPVLPEIENFTNLNANLYCGEAMDNLTLEAIEPIDSSMESAIFTTTKTIKEGNYCTIAISAAKASDSFILKYSFDGSKSIFYQTTTGQIVRGAQTYQLTVYLYPTFKPRNPDIFHEGILIFKDTPDNGIFLSDEVANWQIILFNDDERISTSIKNIANASLAPSPFQPNPKLRLFYDVLWDPEIIATKVQVITPLGAVFEGHVGYAQTTGEAAIVSSLVTLVSAAAVPDDKVEVNIGHCNPSIPGCPE